MSYELNEYCRRDGESRAQSRGYPPACEGQDEAKPWEQWKSDDKMEKWWQCFV